MSDVLIIGVGGAGCNIASYVHCESGERALAINIDNKSLQIDSFKEKLLIDSKVCYGVGPYHPTWWVHAVNEYHNEIIQFLMGAGLIVVIAGLGGNTGTNAVQSIAELAQKEGKRVVIVVIMPFEFEGGRRTDSESKLGELRKLDLDVLVYENSVSGGRDMDLMDYFEKINIKITKAIAAYISQWRSFNNK